MKPQPEIESAKLILNRRSAISVQHSERRGHRSPRHKPERHLATLKSEQEEERLKTDIDEREKTEEIQLLKIKEDVPPKPAPAHHPSNSFWNSFFSLFRRQERGAKSENLETKASPRSKRSLKSMFLQRMNMKEKNRDMISRLPPSPERIKKLWGIARKKVYYLIRLVERVTQDRDQKHREALHGFERQNLVETPVLIPKYIILPNNVYWQIFQIILSVCFSYYLFIVPFRIAFTTLTMDYLPFDVSFDFLYLVEILLNFFAAYNDEADNLVTDHSKIVRKYLRGYFLFDLIALFPFSAVLEVSLFWLFLFKLARFKFFLIWLDTFECLCTYIGQRKKCSQFMTTFNKIARLNTILVVIIYFVSCLWIRIGSEGKTSKNVSQSMIDNNLYYDDKTSTMITSIYFYFTTLTTIGFGDIFPILLAERILIIILEFFGIGLFSYVLSEMMQNFHKFTHSYECKINEKREELRDWIQKRDMARNEDVKDFKPGPKIENYFLFEWRFNYKEMIGCNEFFKKMNLETELNVIPKLFSYFFDDFMAFFKFVSGNKAKIEILKKLTPLMVQEKVLMVQKGKIPKGIYFLLFGKVHLIGKTSQNEKGFPFRKLSPGSFFGEAVLMEQGSKFDIA